MNITSYNVTDVGYHYIGLRVLAGLPSSARREEQTDAIAKSVRKYVNDKALRLMLPEPRGTFETVGEKICPELVHLQFAKSVKKGAYELTDKGRTVLSLLNSRQFQELRRVMATEHLRIYDNLRLVVKKHLELEAIWRPVVNADRLDSSDYITCLLVPTFGEEAAKQVDQVLSTQNGSSPKKMEDALCHHILLKAIPEMHIGVPMFRAMCDRLASLRLLNQTKYDQKGCEFLKTYTPCMVNSPPNDWHVLLDVRLNSGKSFNIHFCEPDMADPKILDRLLEAIYEAFEILTPMAGYYDLSEVRDRVSEHLKIPEAAFDEGLNHILDLDPRPLTVGLQYEGITGRRKPLVRDRGSTQIYNLIRRA